MNSGVTTPSAPSRILIVDEQPLLRAGVIHFLESQESLRVCGEADSVAFARTAVALHQPDLIIMEWQLGSGDTMELIKAFKAQHPAMRMLIYSQCAEAMFAERAIRGGAGGYVMKQEAADELLNAIWMVLRGELYVSRRIATQILQRACNGLGTLSSGKTSSIDKLSDRELHVFRLIGAGLGPRQIASDLNLSVKTVEAHRENIKHKLGLTNGTTLNKLASDWVKGSISNGLGG